MKLAAIYLPYRNKKRKLHAHRRTPGTVIAAGSAVPASAALLQAFAPVCEAGFGVVNVNCLISFMSIDLLLFTTQGLAHTPHTHSPVSRLPCTALQQTPHRLSNRLSLGQTPDPTAALSSTVSSCRKPGKTRGRGAADCSLPTLCVCVFLCCVSMNQVSASMTANDLKSSSDLVSHLP